MFAAGLRLYIFYMAEMNFIKSQVNIEQLVGSGKVNIGGLKTSISYFRDSFSSLAHKSRQIVLKYVMSDKSLIEFPQ